MFFKSLAEVTIEDIQDLCDNRVLESRFIDFKVDPIGNADRDKREFLADISAFANSSGGDLVLGVQTEEGAAAKIVGMQLSDVDKEKLRLGNILRDGLEPRVANIDYSWLQIDVGRGVMIVRCPRSWMAPHRVTFLKDMNFYVRNSAGKNPMSVEELRQAFTFGREISDRLRRFRAERIKAINGNDVPVNLRTSPKVVLHIIPLSSVVDPLDLQFNLRGPANMAPLRWASYSHEHTLEGFVTFATPEPSDSYSLMFRDGAVESVSGINPNGTNGKVSLAAFERLVLNGWKNYCEFADYYNVKAPFYVFVSMIGIIGRVPDYHFFADESPRAARKNEVMFSEAVVDVDNIRTAGEQIFKRLFNTAANVFGLAKSLSYDAAGNYTGTRP